MRIKLTAKLKSLSAFSLLAAYPPPRCTDTAEAVQDLVYILDFYQLSYIILIGIVMTEQQHFQIIDNIRLSGKAYENLIASIVEPKTILEPHYEDSVNTIFNIDCLEVLEKLPDE